MHVVVLINLLERLVVWIEVRCKDWYGLKARSEAVPTLSKRRLAVQHSCLLFGPWIASRKIHYSKIKLHFFYKYLKWTSFKISSFTHFYLKRSPQCFRECARQHVWFLRLKIKQMEILIMLSYIYSICFSLLFPHVSHLFIPLLVQERHLKGKSLLC